MEVVDCGNGGGGGSELVVTNPAATRNSTSEKKLVVVEVIYVGLEMMVCISILCKILGIQKLTNIALKKPRFLCLHGHGSNAAELEEELTVWPKSVTEKMDFVFINGPFPIGDETDVIQRFEWFNLDKGSFELNVKVNTEYDNFEEGISYIEDRMIELGPFDGVLGFSEGAVITGSLPGMQEQGVSLKKVGKIEHVVIISGAKLGGKLFPLPKLAEAAYSSPINIPSLHIFGKNHFYEEIFLCFARL
ncbi:putative serine hydrolase FSH, alpha/beta hydrolase [Tanacetum coccineum]